MNNNYTYNTPDSFRHNNMSHNFHKSSLSWGAIAAGVVTALMTAMVLSLLFIGLGFSSFDVHSQNAGDHSGWALGLGSILLMLISLFAGSYLSGLLSGKHGLAHGFLTWATLSLVALLFSAMAITSALQFSGSLIGGAFNAGSTAISNNDVSISGQDINKQVNQSLKQYGLSDDFLASYRSQLSTALEGGKASIVSIDKLKNSLKSARNHIGDAAKEGYNNPDGLKAIGNKLATTLQKDLDALNAPITLSEVEKQLVSSGTTQEKAPAIAQNALNIYEAARADTRNKITDAKNLVDKGLNTATNWPNQATQMVGDATNKTGHGALWAAFSALLGAAISVIAGSLGAKRHNKYHKPHNIDNDSSYTGNVTGNARDNVAGLATGNVADYNRAYNPVNPAQPDRSTGQRILGDDIPPKL